MCGLVGLVGRSAVNLRLYDVLTVLQHRGQDAAGIVTDKDGRLFMRKNTGLVRDVFHSRHMRYLEGNLGVGHVRYPTAGKSDSSESQPFYVNSPYGIAFAHNGNLVNSEKLEHELFKKEFRHINTDSDSEILLNVFAHELQKSGHLQLKVDDIFSAVKAVHRRCVGGYAAVALIAGYGIVAFRDAHGIRPLVVGRRHTAQGDEYMVASESVALDILGFELMGDVAPGEAVIIEESGELHRQVCTDKASLTPCLFEYVYLARPDSILDGISVYKTHMRMGQKLADKILREWQDLDIDVVIPIPDTGRCAALEVAGALGVDYREGFVKNRYIGRTFIMPGQTMRRKSVRQKLNLIELEFKGKNVLLVDDSIVRGTTCEQIIQMARQAGARNVYFASAAPAVRFPNVYGIDMPAADELIAHGRSEEEICQAIGADALVYQDIEDLMAAAREGNPDVDGFEASVFDGHYVTGGVDDAYLKHLCDMRNDGAKQHVESEQGILGLHNSG